MNFVQLMLFKKIVKVFCFTFFKIMFWFVDLKIRNAYLIMENESHWSKVIHLMFFEKYLLLWQKLFIMHPQ